MIPNRCELRVSGNVNFTVTIPRRASGRIDTGSGYNSGSVSGCSTDGATISRDDADGFGRNFSVYE